jgi:hypothetical protein
MSGCRNEKNVVSTEDVKSLLQRVQYLEDMTAIQKLQSKYVHYLFTQRYDRIVEELYSHTNPDVSVEFSDTGVYRGLESLKTLYAAFERTKSIPGFFIMHMTVNPYIEISHDGMRAKSHWLSPGAANSSTNGSSWIWGPYYVDYIKENGEWRILHSNLVPLFRNPYEYSWNDAPHHGTVRGPLGTEPDEPSTLYRPFNEVKEETDIFRNHPDLPDPF